MSPANINIRNKQLPSTALRSIVQCLINDQYSDEKESPSRCCSNGCAEPVSQAFRAAVWERRVEHLVIQANEDFVKLEGCIRLALRPFVRKVILCRPVDLTSPEATHQLLAATPAKLGKSFAKRLNAFIGSCAKLESFVDNNGLDSQKAVMDGPTIKHPNVKHLGSGFPMLSIQDTPLQEAFPSLKSLKLQEYTIDLFGVPKGTDTC